MEVFYPIFIAFILVFLSELGDKTQLLVLSLSTKLKTITILLGVALGSLFSHGVAILFGSTLSNLGNDNFQTILQFVTYISFIIFGIITLLPEKGNSNMDAPKTGIMTKISMLGFNYILIIAFSIAVGELGDKTFLSSIGLGIQYSNSKIYLIIGAILGMLASDTLAIVLGKLLSQKISDKFIKILSGLLFIIFGLVEIVIWLI